ncbi:MAG: holo-acyl-carrier-protein synthase [Anaerocolumna sp.]|jgi:holo-[acyl-carrier protein] synthase|nr:holo-acyl-carrier-protein synthase [Anaerocolumna sp.]
MIVGIGTDLIEIERVMKACEREHFCRRIFTPKELELAQTDRRKLAGNFAVKEAVVKMLGLGFRGIHPSDIEVLRDEYGKPYVNLFKGAKEAADRITCQRILVTITNTKEFASAFAVGESFNV